MAETLHCIECGTALSERELLLDRDLCDWCKAEEDRRFVDEAAEGWWDEDEELTT